MEKTTKTKRKGKVKYRCIRGFDLENENGERLVIEEGSLWEIDRKSNILGGEVHIKNPEKRQWLELTKQAFKEYFEKVQAQK